VKDSHDQHALGLYGVDEAIGTENQLAKTPKLGIPEAMAAFSELDQGVTGVADLLGKDGRVGR
jgi:hypothetical protein